MTTTVDEAVRVGTVQFHGERAPLLKAIASAQSQIPAIGRDRVNPQLRNRYATLDAMSEAVVPVLASCGLCVMQVSAPTMDRKVTIAGGNGREAREGHGGMVVTTTIVGHEPGAFASFETSVPWQEAPGITIAQAVGIGATYCERYAFRGFFRLAATDDTDTDGAAPHTAPAPQSTRALPAPRDVQQQQPQRQATPPPAAPVPVVAEGEAIPGDDVPIEVRTAWWLQKFADRAPVSVAALLAEKWPARADDVRRAYWTSRFSECTAETFSAVARAMADVEPVTSSLRTSGWCTEVAGAARARLGLKKGGA
jgi:hypothetical protein